MKDKRSSRLVGWYVSAVWVHDGGQLPRGYGVAWADPCAHRYYCLPIPVNRIAGSFRAWWLELRRPCPDDPIVAAYEAGLKEGHAIEREWDEQSRQRLARVEALLARLT